MSPERGRWICSRCCRSQNLKGTSLRTRFGGEKCPTCKDPGVGMEWITSQHMPWDLSDV